MSIEALKIAFTTPMNDPLEKLVFIALANCSNPDSGIAWPSAGYLSRFTGASEATVRRKIKKLVDEGLVTVTHRTGKSSQYTLVTLTTHPCHSDNHKLKETKINKNRKTKVCDWTPSDEDMAYAASKGLNGGEILQRVRMWDQQNGNKAAYVDVQAFWRNWCMREAEKAPKRVTGHSRPINGQSTEWTPPQRRMISLEQWQTMGDGLRTYYKQNRPDVIAELKKVGADV